MAAQMAGMPKVSGLNQVPVLTPQQQGWQTQAGMSGLQQLQNPYQGFEGIENYAQNQFKQNILPSIGQRLGMAGGAQSSPSFHAQLGRAGTDLASQLGALRSQYGFQNQAMGLQSLGMGLQPAFGYAPKQPSALMQLLAPLLGGLALGGSGPLVKGLFTQFGSSQQDKNKQQQTPLSPDVIDLINRIRGGGQ